MSRYIMEHKDDYYDGLSGITQRASWQSWLLYMLKTVEATANLTYNKINDIISAKDAILDAIVQAGEISRPDLIVNALFTQPFSRVKHLTAQGYYAENTARKYLDSLVAMGILEKRIISGIAYYLNLELYRILSE